MEIETKNLDITPEAIINYSPNICKNCIFYTSTGNPAVGDCHRYPTSVLVGNDHWCGEFRAFKMETK